MFGSSAGSRCSTVKSTSDHGSRAADGGISFHRGSNVTASWHQPGPPAICPIAGCTASHSSKWRCNAASSSFGRFPANADSRSRDRTWRVHVAFSDSLTAARSRAKTRHFATRIAPTVMPSFLARRQEKFQRPPSPRTLARLRAGLPARDLFGGMMKQRETQLSDRTRQSPAQTRRQAACRASPAGPNRRWHSLPAALLQPVDDQIAGHPPQPAAKDPLLLGRVPAA